jgi:hypothetical protein
MFPFSFRFRLRSPFLDHHFHLHCPRAQRRNTCVLPISSVYKYAPSGLVEGQANRPSSPFLFLLRDCEATVAHFSLARADSCACLSFRHRSPSPSLVLAIVHPRQCPFSSSPSPFHHAFAGGCAINNCQPAFPLGSISPSISNSELTRRVSTYVTLLSSSLSTCIAALNIPGIRLYHTVFGRKNTRTVPSAILSWGYTVRVGVNLIPYYSRKYTAVCRIRYGALP